MSKKTEKNLIVGLDIGTSKVVAIVGEINPEGGVEIIGIGSHPSRGLKKGTVVNIESTVQSIQRAVEEAELMAGCQIHSVYAGIAGSHIRSLNSHGIVAIRDKEVGQGDIDRVLDAARAVAIPADQKVLHTLPQEFIIDNQEFCMGFWVQSNIHSIASKILQPFKVLICLFFIRISIENICSQIGQDMDSTIQPIRGCN